MPFAAALLLGASSLSAAIPEVPSPQRLVNDFASIFTISQRVALESELVAFDDSTSNQIAVVTVSTLDGMPSSQYATELHRKWGVGGSKNNGIVILIKPKTAYESGDVFISVGYGLEGAITDAWCKRIIEQKMIPHFRDGNYYLAVVDAVDQLKALACGEISEPRDDSDEEIYAAIVSGIIMLLFLILLIKLINKKSNGGNGNYRGGGGRYIYIPPSPGGRSSGLGGGGFSGGGGFRGFGGGMAGGGGAGGRW